MKPMEGSVVAICAAQPGTHVTISAADRRKQREPAVAPVVALAVVVDQVHADGRTLSTVQPVFAYKGALLVPEQFRAEHGEGFRFEVAAP